MQEFEAYYHALKQHKSEEITEHSLRPALEQILVTIKQQENPKIMILHEPKRLKDYGAPDFKLTLHEGILGYVENKALGVNLEEVLKSEQIERYKKLSDNILLTNYLDWIWIKNGKIQSRANLCSLNELLQAKHQIEPAKEKQVKEIIKNFLSTAPQGVASPKTLANALGQRGKLLKTYLYLELQRQEKEETEGKLFGLYNTFKRMVDHELKLEDFSDTFAQMLVYGLFMARLNSGSDTIDLFNVEKYIPTSFELIHELVGFLKVLDNKEYAETRWIVEEVLAVLNTMDLNSITSLLSFDKNNKKADPETARDPYVYFYEDFLAAYDKALKKARGVYYTPPAVVNFIIRAVNDVLKDTFGIEKGLADHKNVTLLDFACGTGTFLLEAIRLILDETPDAKRDLIVKEHILKNLYGFEYMIAPYTVAHLKLTQYLKDRGYELDPEERLKIFLTNTLEHFEVEDERLLPALSTESKQAKGVKDKPILVITGNPPYSYVSKNNGEWIKGLVKDYYYFDGKPLGEKNPKALQDDYVKFIRFAQWKIDQEEEGIVAIITNHSFLNNITLRGMRESLLKSFNSIYILNLHGNISESNEQKDVNVFDIKQGVAISIFIKSQKVTGLAYKDIVGDRGYKNKYLYTTSKDDIDWQAIDSIKPLCLFNKTISSIHGYDSFTSINAIFEVFNSGIKTHRDNLVIDFTEDLLVTKLQDFVAAEFRENIFKIKHGVTDDEMTKFVSFREKGSIAKINSNNIHKISYRIFDTRFVYYDPYYIDRPRQDVMRHMLSENIGIVTVRQVADGEFNHVFVTSHIIDNRLMLSSKGHASLYPLYRYHETEFLSISSVDKISNINPKIIHDLTSIYEMQEKNLITEQILFGYINAILHSPTYREKYKDFLKTDFPRIPFCEDYSTFEQLSQLGWRLINAHLMKSSEPAKQFPELGQYKIKGDNLVDKVFYTDHLQRLSINATQYFEPVPPEIFNFHIGGYQVLNKYLKDRKGRTLSLDEIDNVENIVRILAYTKMIMQEIDDKTKEWI